MVKVIACVRPETLAYLDLDHLLRDHVALTCRETAQDIFDTLWEVGHRFEMVVLDGVAVDVQDLLVAARNGPGTEFILHDCATTAAYLKAANIVEAGTLTMLRDHLASRCEHNAARQGRLS